MDSFKGWVIPVTFDPRFVLSVRLSQPSALLGKQAGDVVNFAIHSPTLTFRESCEACVNRSFVFELSEYQTPIDRPGCYCLEVIRESAEDSSRPSD